MKINPVVGAPRASMNPNEGHSASSERRARAKAAITGEALPQASSEATTPLDGQTMSPKRIKLRTQMSTNRHQQAPEASVLSTQGSSPAVAAPEGGSMPAAGGGDSSAAVSSSGAQESDKTELGEQGLAANEETKPLSPQFAALAKQKRALQLKEQELLAKEKALTDSGASTKSLEDYRARIKANALNVLLEEGVTYDQLTEQILAQGSGNQDLTQVESKLKALEGRLESQTKTHADQEAQTEKRVLAQIGRNVDQLVAEGDDFEMIREAGYGPKVVDLIHRTYKQTGEVMDETEAAKLIEDELLEESLRFARIKKVQSRLTPAESQQQTQPVQTDRGNFKTMRTLTNRDGVSPLSMSKRERAIAAMEGRLRK